MNTLLSWIVIVLLILSLGGCTYFFIQNLQDKDNIENQQFYLAGIEAVKQQLFATAGKCEQIPITYPILDSQTNQTRDVTITLVALECLQN